MPEPTITSGQGSSVTTVVHDDISVMLAGQQVNSERSGNRTATHRLLRMELAWKDEVYRFAVNPEDYTQSEPNKATITQTKGGAWIDAWGEGIKEITIKGTTGQHGHPSIGARDDDVGYRRWKNLRNLFQHVYDDVRDGEKVELMELWNFTDNEFYYVYPAQGGVELYRNKARPAIYQYTIHLWAVRRIGQPEKERQQLGNPGLSKRAYHQQLLNELTDLSEEYRTNDGSVNLTQMVQVANRRRGESGTETH